VMVHPSDSEACKALDNFDVDITRDVRNVHIGLSTNGFTPYNLSAASYSCWSIFAINFVQSSTRSLHEMGIYVPVSS
jgi:hypothetical protein